MRERITITVLLLSFFVIGASAQSSSDNATLTVLINPSIALVLTDINPTLVFDEAADFATGVSYLAEQAGTVTATRAYDLSVLAAGDISDGSGNSIPISSVAVEPSALAGTTNQVSLSTTAQNILNNAPAGLAVPFGLEYSTAPNDQNFVNVPNGTYTVVLTYTATLD